VDWQDSDFPVYDWTLFYPRVNEDILTNAPPARRRCAQMNVFVDANHAGNKLTRQSHTGILIYLNPAPIIWYSKVQKTVQSSTFGSEL